MSYTWTDLVLDTEGGRSSFNLVGTNLLLRAANTPKDNHFHQPAFPWIEAAIAHFSMKTKAR